MSSIFFNNRIRIQLTFKYYFKRFTRDHRDREFFDGRGKEFNLLDKAMSLYFKQFREERLRMNRIEDLTLGELDPYSADPDVKWLVGEMHRRGFALNEWGRNLGHTEQVIAEWYRQKTLLGAHGVDDNGRDFLEMRRDELLGELKAQLQSDGIQVLNPQGNLRKLTPQELADRIKEFEEAGLLRQVNNNAYHMTWAMGAFSDYDIIRIWDRSKNWFGGRKRLGDVVKSQDSRPWWGWHIDHYGEFLHFEPRGRAGRFGRNLDTNYILQKHMMGQRRNILPNNRLLVKLINDNLSNEQLELSLDMVGNRKLKEQIDQKIRGTAGNLYRDRLENVDKLDLKDGDDYGFARGWATAELIDFGEVSFEKVEWSKILDRDNECSRGFLDLGKIRGRFSDRL